MGFSVTAAHVIFATALLAGGSALAGAFVHSHEKVQEARRLDAETRDAAVHTSIRIVAESWDPTNKIATYTIDNEGSTTLDVKELDFVVDGDWATDAVRSGWTVDAVATDWWAPETTLVIGLDLLNDPAAVVVTTEYGPSAVWRG